MQWLILAGLFIVACFAFVLLFGAPYVPSLTAPSKIALDMIALKPGDTLLELGSGDGKVLLVAAERGWNVVGVELNPLLVIISWVRTWRYRKQVKIVWGNLWRTSKWPQSEGIFVFLLPKYMERLDKEVTKWHTHPIKLVSFAFPIPNKATLQQDKLGVYMYEYK